MPADQAGTGPGPPGEEPSKAIGDEIRPHLSVADLVGQDLPTWPLRVVSRPMGRLREIPQPRRRRDLVATRDDG
jgi:hypothetical protein